MSNVDTREVTRNNFFLLADIRLTDGEQTYRVRVRNLSSGGMMADGPTPLKPGAKVIVDMRNVGEVTGTVAWVQGQRCGIAFAREIDPALARAPAANPDIEKYVIPRRLVPVDNGVMRANLRNI